MAEDTTKPAAGKRPPAAPPADPPKPPAEPPTSAGDPSPSYAEEALDALKLYGIRPDDEAPAGEPGWTVTLEPNGEEPHPSAAEALQALLDAAHHDGRTSATSSAPAVHMAHGENPTHRVETKLRAVSWKMGATEHVGKIGDTIVARAKFMGSQWGKWKAACELDKTELDDFATDAEAMEAAEARVLEVIADLITTTVVAIEGGADA
jgi:hypothetical protein